MNINENTYVLGLWHINIPQNTQDFPKGGDILYSISRDKNNEKEWIGEFRIRKNYSLNVWDNQDEKTFYDFKISNKTEDQVEFFITIQIEKMMQDLNVNFKYDYFPIKGDINVFQEKIKNNPPKWMHVKILDRENDKEEIEKLTNKK